MPTATISETSRERTPLGVLVVYEGTERPGQQYVCYAVSMNDLDVNAAIAAHIRQRKAAGVYYAGEPTAAPRERVVAY